MLIHTVFEHCWYVFQGSKSCYSIHANFASQDVAKILCRNRGGHLVYIETIEEFDELREFIIQNYDANAQYSGLLWTGLEKAGDNWYWGNGKQYSLPTIKWEPGYFLGDCLMIAHRGSGSMGPLFRQAECIMRRNFMCEYEY